MGKPKPKKKKPNRALARLIQNKSVEIFKASRNTKNKRKFLIVKNQKALKHRAQQYDNLVHSLLSDRIEDPDKVLIFNYENGFVYTDKNNFGNYSIRL
ncbi:late transcription unit protein LtuB [Candidatus Chlamydia sanziniae]|uniref:late transcription unit protein LtuB n=1 Tax=Candidatus Chlamydia sanziniae TaxID=1806891 RepID=UPI00082E01E8|nr:late transcription unit protein LtuB [Candidatus Chlamydia sanziniae]